MLYISESSKVEGYFIHRMLKIRKAKGNFFTEYRWRWFKCKKR